jgi:hypothetical protein
MEVPSYSTKPNTVRILLPRIINIILLSALLYTGVRVEFYTLNKEFPSMINLIVTAGILILASADIFLTYNKNKDSKIYFFNDSIEIRGKEDTTVQLGIITGAEVKKNAFDTILKTGDILLSDGNKIKNLKHPDRIKDYIMQLLRKTPQMRPR